ncbi:MAG: acetate--CoA ligase family protein [archaeon]
MKSLNFIESTDFLNENKVPFVLEIKTINKEKDLLNTSINSFPYVMKLSSSLLHKTEKRAVCLNLINQKDLVSAFNSLSKLMVKEKIKGNIILQKQVFGQELIIGIKEDQVFGKVIMFGLGGIYTEIIKDVTFKVLPITEKDAEDMISKSKVGKILSGARGIKYPTTDLIGLLVKISNLTIKKDIKELDLNPVIINEKGLFVVDARVLL